MSEVTVLSHDDFDDLLDRLQRAAAACIVFRGEAYRSVEPKYAKTADLLTGLGSKRGGGRWNPPGSFPTVYTSLSPGQALEESLHTFKHFGFSPASVLPRTVVGMKVQMSRVLDLTDQSILRRLEMTRTQMVSDDWRGVNDGGHEALTQAIGRVAFELGIEGLLVPASASADGQNLLWFPDNLSGSSTAEILNADQLG